MNTMNKEFKARVRQYIIKRLDTEDSTDLVTQLSNVVLDFDNWYCKYEQRITPNKQMAFTKWLQGLPSVIYIEFKTYKMREVVRDWHNQSSAEAELFSDEKVEKAYYRLIYREFVALCKDNGIEF